jgi:purine-binding chemotaxis protein CheW
LIAGGSRSGSSAPPWKKGNATSGKVAHETHASRPFLAFHLEDWEYGFELFRIQEICGSTPFTRLPNLHAQVGTVTIRRGTLQLMIDLRIKFRLPDAEYSEFS